MIHRSALSAQTVHERSISEPLLFRRGNSPIAQGLEALAEGGQVDDGLWRQLENQGFEMVLVWDRVGNRPEVQREVEQALGPPVAPGVYRLSGWSR